MKGKKISVLSAAAVTAAVMLSMPVSSSALCIGDLLRAASGSGICAGGNCKSLSDILGSFLTNRQNGCQSGQCGTAPEPAESTTPEPAESTTPEPAESTTPKPVSVSSQVQQVFELVNRERAAAGLKALVLDEKLCAAAAVRAGEIAGYFSHTRPDGRSCFTVFAENGISYRRAGENIASGQTSAESVMNGWMNSPGHRANILNSSFTRIGIACKKIGGRYQWVQLFAS